MTSVRKSKKQKALVPKLPLSRTIPPLPVAPSSPTSVPLYQSQQRDISNTVGERPQFTTAIPQLSSLPTRDRDLKDMNSRVTSPSDSSESGLSSSRSSKGLKQPRARGSKDKSASQMKVVSNTKNSQPQLGSFEAAVARSTVGPKEGGSMEQSRILRVKNWDKTSTNNWAEQSSGNPLGRSWNDIDPLELQKGPRTESREHRAYLHKSNHLENLRPSLQKGTEGSDNIVKKATSKPENAASIARQAYRDVEKPTRHHHSREMEDDMPNMIKFNTLGHNRAPSSEISVSPTKADRALAWKLQNEEMFGHVDQELAWKLQNEKLYGVSGPPKYSPPRKQSSSKLSQLPPRAPLARPNKSKESPGIVTEDRSSAWNPGHEQNPTSWSTMTKEGVTSSLVMPLDGSETAGHVNTRISEKTSNSSDQACLSNTPTAPSHLADKLIVNQNLSSPIQGYYNRM